MNIGRITRGICLAVILPLFFACGNKAAESGAAEETIAFKDYYGREVAVKTNPQKVVSLSPGITELLFDLQVGDRIAGRTNYCLYPEEAKKIPSVGGISDANMEMIMAKKPEIVFTASMVAKEMVDKMASSGLCVVCLPEGKKVTDVYETVTFLGKVFGKEKLADSLIGNMKKEIANITSSIPSDNKPTVYYVAGFGNTGDFTSGGDTFIDDIITLSGGENIAKHIKGWSISKEEIFKQQPEYIIVRQEDLETFKTTAPYNKLKAVKENRILGIESSITDCQSLRTPQAIKQISNFIHNNK